MASRAIFILSKNNSYQYNNYDNSAGFDVSICVAIERDGMEGEGTHQVSFHAHSDYEMHLVLEGSCEFDFEGGAGQVVGKNQFIIVPPGKKHRIINESPTFSKLITNFTVRCSTGTDNVFYRVFENEIVNVKTLDANNKILHLAAEMIENATLMQHEYKSLISTYLYAYLIEIARVTVGGCNIIKPIECNDARLSSAIEFIKANVSNHISVKAVSDHCFISAKQLSRIFMSHLGTTPSEYIRRSKIDFACGLLLETDLPIFEIAEQLGFAEVTAFINFFKRYENITPANFRKAGR